MKVMTRDKYTERDYRRTESKFSVLRCQRVTLRPMLAYRKQASGKTSVVDEEIAPLLCKAL